MTIRPLSQSPEVQQAAAPVPQVPGLEYFAPVRAVPLHSTTRPETDTLEQMFGYYLQAI